MVYRINTLKYVKFVKGYKLILPSYVGIDMYNIFNKQLKPQNTWKLKYLNIYNYIVFNRINKSLHIIKIIKYNRINNSFKEN